MAYNIHQQLEMILHKQIVKYSLREHATDNTGQNSKEMLRRALCNGYFCNVARKSSAGNSFRTMDGHGTQVYIHPSSTLFGCEDQLEWIIFHDIIWTSKIYVRTVCPIRYEWVRDLLPRLHEVDSYSLSGWAEGKLTTRKQEADESKLNTALQAGSTEETPKISKRNTEDTITAARQRFQERKRARDQQQ